MKIYTAAQIREADAYTIDHTPISSLALMENAALACTDWLAAQHIARYPVAVFCGMGNNGGDGLAITRQLRNMGCHAHAYIVRHSDKATDDHQANYKSLQRYYPDSIHELTDFPTLAPGTIIIDAILGTGLSRPAEGLVADVIRKINETQLSVIAIDMPSGLLADTSSLHYTAIQADHTLSFEYPKLAFLLPENALNIGEVHILPIGLHPDYKPETRYNITDGAMMKDIYRPRKPFSHKGTFGHALLIAGSYGKMGAAVLSAQSCLKTGVGLLTCHIPQCGYDIMQISVPAAMCITDPQFDHSSSFPSEEEAKKYKTIGVGPGLGTADGSSWGLDQLLDHYQQPMVIDADALNILSKSEKMFAKVPKGSILTPHPKEFERLFGPSENDIARLALLSEMAVTNQICILLKGRYTAMASPDGELYFNATGNPGMATGGSGDVLTGILTSLLAQGYSSKEAMLLGVYIHGLAGDFAAAALSQEAMTAEDIPDYLGRTFLSLHKNQ